MTIIRHNYEIGVVHPKPEGLPPGQAYAIVYICPSCGHPHIRRIRSYMVTDTHKRTSFECMQCGVRWDMIEVAGGFKYTPVDP